MHCSKLANLFTSWPKSWNPTGWNTKCATAYQKKYFTCYLSLMIIHVKSLKDQLILSRDIDNQRIWQSDWMGVTTGRTQPNAEVSQATFPWRLVPCKKTKVPLDSFQRYGWLNNPAIGLDERNNWPHPTKR